MADQKRQTENLKRFTGKLCDPCTNRQPWEGICPACTALVEGRA